MILTKALTMLFTSILVENYMKNQPKVSILVPVFNHAKFIGQMIQGALMQQTDFAFEIIIGDDASTDGTQAIIQQYASQFPQIKAFLHPQNLGPTTPRELGGKNNVAFLFEQCSGQYIALCEGDDYWTDALKLQKQVDFLDNHPEYSICHHQLEVIYEDNSPAHPFNDPDQADTSDISDLLRDNKWILGTASTVFRNVFQSGLADWWWKSASGDLGIFIQAARHGKIKYLPETMGCYRKHSGGMTTIHTPKNLFFLQNRMEMFKAIDLAYQQEYTDILSKTVQHYNTIIKNLTNS